MGGLVITHKSNSFFSKYAFWLVLVLCLTALGTILFMPFPSDEEKIIERKKMGDDVLGQKLLEIDNIEIVKMGYWKDDAIEDYAKLFKFEAKMLVRNHSDLEISLIRAKAKLVFRNFKERAQDEGELDFDIGIKIPPNSQKVCYTNLWAKYENSDALDFISDEILNNEREVVISRIYEIWADEPSFNPFSEIISFFKSM